MSVLLGDKGRQRFNMEKKSELKEVSIRVSIRHRVNSNRHPAVGSQVGALGGSSLGGAVSAGKENTHGGVVSDEEEEGVVCDEPSRR